MSSSSHHSRGPRPAHSVLPLVLTLWSVLLGPRWPMRLLASLGFCLGSSCRHSRKAGYSAEFLLLHWTQWLCPKLVCCITCYRLVSSDPNQALGQVSGFSLRRDTTVGHRAITSVISLSVLNNQSLSFLPRKEGIRIISSFDRHTPRG